MTKISHSAVSKYLACGEMYRLHYIEKIRPTELKSPLVFGDAFDTALNAMLVGNKNYLQIFEDKFMLAKDSALIFLKSDLDYDLITEEEKTNPEFYTLLKKGKYMLEAYASEILPYLEVIAIQEPISLKNNDGDEVIGIVDLVAKIGGETYILDNKTTSRPYKKDSVKTSEQLALYVHALKDKYNTTKAGYLTVSKSIRKNKVKVCSKCGHSGTGFNHKTCDNIINGNRCNGTWDITMYPKSDTQIILDEVSIEFENSVVDIIDEVNHNIKSGVFCKNEGPTCTNYFGSKCPYYNLCYHGKYDGLKDFKKTIDNSTK